MYYIIFHKTGLGIPLLAIDIVSDKNDKEEFDFLYDIGGCEVATKFMKTHKSLHYVGSQDFMHSLDLNISFADSIDEFISNSNNIQLYVYADDKFYKVDIEFWKELKELVFGLDTSGTIRDPEPFIQKFSKLQNKIIKGGKK